MNKEYSEEEQEEKSTPEVLRRFIAQYKDHIQDTAAYIETRNWGRKVEIGDFPALKKENGIEWTLVKNLKERLTYFIKEAEGNLDKKFAVDFIKLLRDLLEGYITRCNIYMKLNKWSEIQDDDDYMDVQITFQDELLKNINELRKELGKINLDEAKDSKKIPIHGDKKVPFLMKDIIEKRFPKQFT